MVMAKEFTYLLLIIIFPAQNSPKSGFTSKNFTRSSNMPSPSDLIYINVIVTSGNETGNEYNVELTDLYTKRSYLLHKEEKDYVSVQANFTKLHTIGGGVRLHFGGYELAMSPHDLRCYEPVQDQGED